MEYNPDIQEYRKSLEALSKENSPLIISNSGKEHAVVLYSMLLDASCKSVRIFCQSGNSAVWHDPVFRNSMENFLEKHDSELMVLTAHEPALDSYWTEKVNVSAKQISNHKKEMIYDHFRNRNCNFSVFDSNKYRYEYDCDAFKAYGCFNDCDMASELISLFNDAFEEKASANA